MIMLRFDRSDCVVKNLVDPVCNVVRFERSRNDDSRTLHVLVHVHVSFVSCLHASVTVQF